ncbi:ADP-ribosylglycohydrolase family protein [Paenibacillus sp. IB182496]|uniref:ADP-ribosylglycohydrolase family protein n=1 Tax=Paenibacillus sabuli TaxID=2772509 RepID=A0A927BX90_9BACL|nr:ADP-ribosylglycohydrolase family protein [Paenibacillus sabuli]MBD2847119.1 ADP-ribosylglycohydrolase family protein [Paenibacillus sabuli]
MKRTPAFYRGCLVGGAIGDALGWPVEFDSYETILAKYGSGGIRDLQPGDAGAAEITDDTQMTLFTAEGILRAESRGRQKGIAHSPSAVYYAYQRWLLTQGYPKYDGYAWAYKSWLLDVQELYARRAPGHSCLSALSSRTIGTAERPINDSKGCGGVMRAAPAGLFYPKEQAFDMAVKYAALTHGHPSGYLSAGALAYLVAAIIEGQSLEAAVAATLGVLPGYTGHEECTRCLQSAVRLAQQDRPDVEAIAELGEGWVGEEALGIAVYCALKHARDFRQALIAAVNHSGDSDSTGAITGNILGAALGYDRIPADWAAGVELQDVLLRVADDLLAYRLAGQLEPTRYPGD